MALALSSTFIAIIALPVLRLYNFVQKTITSSMDVRDRIYKPHLPIVAFVTNIISKGIFRIPNGSFVTESHTIITVLIISPNPRATIVR